MTKALVLLEMLTLNNNKMMPFTVLEIYEVHDSYNVDFEIVKLPEAGVIFVYLKRKFNL